MTDSDSGMPEPAEEQMSPRALCPSIIFFCSKGMIEGVVVFLFIWLLVQVLLNKQQEVHLQVLLGAGLALLCFCLLLGCAICWHRNRRTPLSLSLSGSSKEAASENRGGQEPSVSVPIPQQYQDMDGDITPRGEEELPSPLGSDSLPRRNLHTRASLPSLHQLPSRTRRALQRRCTVFGDVSLGERARLVRVPLSRTVPDALSGAKEKPRPRLHFTLRYSLDEEALTVTVTGLSNLPKRFHQRRDSWVKAYLLPGFVEPRPEPTQGPDGGQRFSFWRHSLEELKELTLRLAVYARERHSLREGFIGEVLFSCAQGDWHSHETSGYTRELSTAKTKLKKSLSTMDVLSAPCPGPKPLGQLFVLLQYQALANRVKVMVQKAQNLVKLTRVPGAPDHFVSIRLSQGGHVRDMKETKSVSGYSPVWNAPFLFDAPAEAVRDETLGLEFLVMQGRIYNRARILGRVVIGRGATEAGIAHWQEMCHCGPAECARWHALQPDVF